MDFLYLCSSNEDEEMLGIVGLWLVTVCAYGQQVQLDTLRVQYVDFQGKNQCGELICNRWGGAWRSLKDYQHFEK